MTKKTCPAINKLKILLRNNYRSFIAFKLGLDCTRPIDNWTTRNKVSAAYVDKVLELYKELK